jgi:hypothetical protein
MHLPGRRNEDVAFLFQRKTNRPGRSRTDGLVQKGTIVQGAILQEKQTRGARLASNQRRVAEQAGTLVTDPLCSGREFASFTDEHTRCDTPLTRVLFGVCLIS